MKTPLIFRGVVIARRPSVRGNNSWKTDADCWQMSAKSSYFFEIPPTRHFLSRVYCSRPNVVLRAKYAKWTADRQNLHMQTTPLCLVQMTTHSRYHYHSRSPMEWDALHGIHKEFLRNRGLRFNVV